MPGFPVCMQHDRTLITSQYIQRAANRLDFALKVSSNQE